MFFPFMYFDQFYLLLILPALLISVIAQNAVNRTYKKYAKISVRSVSTAASTARSILNHHGLSNVPIERIGGRLTDHYDPRSKTLCLSQSVHDSNSIAALGVAAHEVAHALQHREGYMPLRIRNSIAPVVSVVSTLAVPLLLFGFLLSMLNLVYIGIAAFSLAVVFQLVTLPVEVNASHRALVLLQSGNFLTGQEAAGSKKVLRAAAFTYVASTLMSIVYFVRFLMLAPRRN
ncbi:MAG: zinc metallopeptidase [Bacillota bacterium]